MTKTKKVIKKQRDERNNKNVYLLGKDNEGIKYWLESPNWDCNWYWGFGYVKTYQQNWMPSKARDISSHEHIDSSFLGQHEYYDFNLKLWKQSEYIHNIFENPKFTITTFTEKEGWVLSELFKEFYLLSDCAKLFGRGGAHITTSPIQDLLKNAEYVKHINNVLIPAITSEIIKILSPTD